MHVHNFLTVQRMFKMNRWMVVEKEHINVFTSVRQTGGQFINIHVIRTCVLWRLYTDWVTCVVYECCRMNRGHNWQMAYWMMCTYCSVFYVFLICSYYVFNYRWLYLCAPLIFMPLSFISFQMGGASRDSKQRSLDRSTMSTMSSCKTSSSSEADDINREVKVVVVGPARTGKTSLIQRFVNDKFSDVSLHFDISMMGTLTVYSVSV